MAYRKAAADQPKSQIILCRIVGDHLHINLATCHTAQKTGTYFTTDSECKEHAGLLHLQAQLRLLGGAHAKGLALALHARTGGHRGRDEEQPHARDAIFPAMSAT